MLPTIDVSCRVDYRPVGGDAFCEHTTRLESVYVTGCTIRSPHLPDSSEVELRIYLPGSDWPLRVDQAKVTWGHWAGFTVEFLSMPTRDQQRLQHYLEAAGAVGDSCVLPLAVG